MKFRSLLFLLIGTFVFDAHSQAILRERPAEWENLVFGGRFMDRFLPIPAMGELTSDTWGASDVVPRYTQNGIEDNEYSYWGGNATLGPDGKYHLFVCGWKENSPRGHMYWSKSTVFHAVADHSLGPYKVKQEIGPGHNPEIFQLQDGRYVIYVIDGRYIGSTLEGPWEYSTFEFDRRDRRIIEGLSNLTFARREDGSFLMVCRGGGVWFSKDGLTPYNQVTDRRVYPAVEGRFEDPVVWKTNVQYHLVVNDWYGRIAWYLRSKDGINWKVDPGEAYLPGVSKYEDGTVENWFKYERLKVLQDEYGRATQAHFAVIDTLKREDKENDNHSSKHICIPLTVGRLLTILDKDKITSDTKQIRIKVEAEDNFNPHTDMDLESLRFGASEEVNFGRGCKVLKTEKAGKDLIITFDAKGNGFTNDNFAAKLLGKTSDGKLLFGYARLPWLNYIEPALSARLPKIVPDHNGLHLEIEVQNFGQVVSNKSKIVVHVNQKGKLVKIASGTVNPLSSFEKKSIKLATKFNFDKNIEYDTQVTIFPPEQKPVILEGIITIDN